MISLILSCTVMLFALKRAVQVLVLAPLYVKNNKLTAKKKMMMSV